MDEALRPMAVVRGRSPHDRLASTAPVPNVVEVTDGTDWPSYLASSHAMNPGITEDVLSRCASDGTSPYEWLTETVDPADRVLDLACGSGPAKPAVFRQWTGLDLSAAELDRALSNGPDSLLLGDATAVPIRDQCVDTVTCSMALMLVQPLNQSLTEVHRVLEPGGRLLLLLPARRPLHFVDQAAYARLFWVARSTTKFPPTAMRRHAAESLASHGLLVESDESRRFEYPMQDPADADRLVDSWYLPGVPTHRRDAARARARRMRRATIGIPLRRVIARRAT